MRERFPDELKGRVLATVQFRELRLSVDGRGWPEVVELSSSRRGGPNAV